MNSVCALYGHVGLKGQLWYMLLLMYRTLSISSSFEHPKQMSKLVGKKILNYTLKIFVQLEMFVVAVDNPTQSGGVNLYGGLQQFLDTN